MIAAKRHGRHLLDVGAIAIAVATFLQKGEPDLLFHAIWVVLVIEAFAYGLRVSAPRIALMFIAFGWKGTFLVVGAMGFIWVLPWLIIYKSGPSTHPWVSAAERTLILDAPEENAAVAEGRPAYVPNLRQLLSHRQSWAIIGARFFLDPIWWLFVSWLPIYLAETFGFDVKQIGLFAWVPFVGAMIGSLAGGWEQLWQAACVQTAGRLQ